MSKAMIKWVGFFICVFLLFSLAQKSASQEHGLLLEGIDGKKHALNEYIGKGQWVVVNVWATACPYCRRELFDLASFHDDHHEKDAIVLGLALDLETFDFPDKDYLANFVSTYLIDYPVLLVSGEVASKVLGHQIHTVPMTFFYNLEGKLAYQFTGELSKEMLEDAIKNIKPSQHANLQK